MAAAQRLEIIPLGGLGEFGMNMMVYRSGGDCLIVDAGMMFPGEEHLGVDVVIPDLDFLDDCGRILGVVLTHGHEDHIGALPYVLARHHVPLWTAPYTRGLVEARLDEHAALERPQFHALPDGDDAVEIGPFRLQTIRVAHSIPQSRMLVLHTPVGTLLHTADFKLDVDPPDGAGTDLARLERLGRAGVLALLSDSTNADRPGTTPGERSASHGLDRVIAAAPRRVLVTLFSSNVQRVAEVAAIAARHGRQLALVGRSLETHAAVAERLGLLRFAPGLRVAPDDVMSLPPERTLIVTTGSQGEPLSALARIAVGKHRHVAVEAGDIVVHSAREIPGNEKSIGRMIDHLMRRGADVVTSRDAPIHVSGHAAAGELQRLIEIVRPRFLLPIHGEYRQLRAHARLGVASGLTVNSVPIAESGDVVALDEGSMKIVDRVRVGQIFIDAALDEVDRDLLRDRRRSAGDGIVVAVVAVDRIAGPRGAIAEIVTRGFVPDGGESVGLMAEARRVVGDAVAEATPEERRDEAMLKARIHSELKRFLRRRVQRHPLIIPVIVEL